MVAPGARPGHDIGIHSIWCRRSGFDEPPPATNLGWRQQPIIAKGHDPSRRATTYDQTADDQRVRVAPTPVVLALDSAGLACSAVVATGETVLGAERVQTVHGQAERLLPMVDTVMRKARLPSSALDIVGTSIGPGSFTGVRVGLAAAHGIALATRARLIGVTGFEAVAASVARSAQDGGSGFLLVALESRREDLYVQLFDHIHGPLRDPAAVMPAALEEVLYGFIGSAPLLVAGDAAHRAANALSRRLGTKVAEGSAPDATGVLQAVLRCWRTDEQGAKPLPLYLRPPDVTFSNARQRGKR